MLIDTHCHLSFKAFDESWPEVVKRAREKDVKIITVGSSKDTSEKAIKIAEKSEGVFVALGLHPTHTDEKFDYDWFSQAADKEKVVAIGETGIDYFHLDEQSRAVILQKQEDLLRQHLVLAKEKNLPVILHGRDLPLRDEAYDHLYKIITDFGYTRCVLHCFGGNWETAQKFLDLGCLISFTGIVSFKNAGDSLKEVVRNIPLDKFMIETDAPYLAPEPYRGKQNEPAFVEYVARAIADIRGVPYDDIAQATTENAVKFYGTPRPYGRGT